MLLRLLVVTMLAILLTGCCCFGGSDDDEVDNDTGWGPYPPHSEGAGNGI
jgi:hypothetical protein